jgi:hypothetical protein
VLCGLEQVFCSTIDTMNRSLGCGFHFPAAAAGDSAIWWVEEGDVVSPNEVEELTCL